MSTVNRNVKFLYFAPRLSPPAPLPRARLFVPFLTPVPHRYSPARGFSGTFPLLRHATPFHRVAFSAISRSCVTPRPFHRVAFSAISHSRAPPLLPRAWLFGYFPSPVPHLAPSPRGFLRAFSLLSPLKNESSRLCRFNLIGLIIKLYRRFKIMVKIFLLIILTRQSIYGSICNTKSLTDQSKEGIWHLKHLKNCQMTRKN